MSPIKFWVLHFRVCFRYDRNNKNYSLHTVLYQFQIPLEEEISKFFDILFFYHYQKWGRKKFDFQRRPLLLPSKPAQPIWPNLALVGQFGCAGWLVTTKAIVGSLFFPFPILAYKSRPKCKKKKPFLQEACDINITQCA